MVGQVNVKFPDDFYNLVMKVSKKEGYMSVPEFIRSLVRDYLADELSDEERKKILSIYNKTERTKGWLSEKKAFDALKTK